ncbi:hypothetical protein QE250_01235 [Chromatiaceae bacterium AAb-1]|nr:hypothetical protein [Chromatiaceae bacterium AAb-1]
MATCNTVTEKNTLHSKTVAGGQPLPKTVQNRKVAGLLSKMGKALQLSAVVYTK